MYSVVFSWILQWIFSKNNNFKSLNLKSGLKGCESNFEVFFTKFYKLLQVKQLPCIKQYVLG